MSEFRLVVGKGVSDHKALKHLVSRLNLLKPAYATFNIVKIHLIAPKRWVAVVEYERKRSIR